MSKSILANQKRGRGRPATGRDPAVALRLPEATIKTVDKWVVRNDMPSRSEALRRLIELGLTVPTNRKRKRGAAVSQATHDSHAERAAEDYIDNALKHEHEDVRAARKKQLTTMPSGAKRR
jgi:metal-responsive CopG/Arc/MetJ family transcriptional regulator